jgi:hypothetical protein
MIAGRAVWFRVHPQVHFHKAVANQLEETLVVEPYGQDRFHHSEVFLSAYDLKSGKTTRTDAPENRLQ